MPDQPHTLKVRHVAPSDSNDQQSLTTIQKHGSRKSATQDVARRTSSYDPKADSAYGTNPASGIVLCNPAFGSSSSANNSDAALDTTTGTAYCLAAASNNAENVPDLNLAPFGSQPWPTTSAPYLDFAPQLVYEPAGELAQEAIEGFQQFDDPSIFEQPVWASEPEKTAAASRNAIIATSSVVHSPNILKNGHILLRPALKRALKSDSAFDSQIADDSQGGVAQAASRKIRRVSFEKMSGTAPGSADDQDSSASEAPTTNRSQGQHVSATRQGRGARVGRPSAPRGSSQAASARISSGAVGGGSQTPSGHSPSILPPEKVFPIQIGSELFRLSGASISSDAPSYFTQFFEEQIRQNEESGGVRTLYIDRDPETFRDIACHLQGYYVKPRDGSHFVKLFADAQFYSLPRLIDQLFEAEIFIQIGEKHFQIPKDIFSDPGNSPNFFSLGYAVFFSTPGEVFPGLDRRGLLRPPSITPPYVSGRSAEIFAQILHLLRGYPLRIENESHRAELLRDCRYFHLRGLEQKIIAHEISYNLERRQNEICLRIEDIKPSGISYKTDESETEQDITGGWVCYARPFVDDDPQELIVEIGGETTVLDLDNMRLDFHGLAKARISSLLQVIANKMNLPTNAPLGAMLLSGMERSSYASPGHTPLSEDRVKVRFESASDITLDGARYDVDWTSTLGQCMSHGPSVSDDDCEGSDTMDDGQMPEQQSAPQGPHRGSGQQAQTQSQVGRTGSSVGAHRGTNVLPPRLGTATATPRKRRRPTISTASNASGRGEWVLRTGQWRLRVQQSEQNPIRGRFEIVFMAVKVDAFSQERARNAQRKFLTGSG